MSERWTIQYAPTARRALAEVLPEGIAAAAFGLITGALAVNPHRVGKPLTEPCDGLYAARRGTYRILYRIDADRHTVEIHSIRHRRDAYGS